MTGTTHCILNAYQTQLLRHQPLFSSLNEADWQTVLAASQPQALSKGEFLFLKGDKPTHFYMLLQGRIKLSLLSEDGDEKIVNILDHPMCFAEAMMLGAVPFCPLNAQAIDDAQVITIDSATYRNVLLRSPQACLQTISALSKRLHWMINEISHLTLHNASYRLIHYLIEYVNLQKTWVLDTPKSTIAARISVKPETLSRILKQLQDAGLIETDGKNIRILNLEGLRHHVNPAES